MTGTARVGLAAIMLAAGTLPLPAQTALPARASAPPPIIDMHLHAVPAASQGPPPLAFCLPITTWPAGDPKRAWPEVFMEWLKTPACADPLWSAETDEELMRRTLAVLERRNITGVTSGPLLDAYHASAPDRVIRSLGLSLNESTPPVDSVRAWLQQGRYQVLGEVTIQYDGAAPGDERFAPYFALAEEMDVPVGIHVGTGPPGAPYLGFTEYRARLHSPLLLEETLLRHPRLRVYLMHAGWPMMDDLLALMWTHPQVYVDVGVISFVLPRPAFHDYLRRIVEAGFGNRVLFGSDQMVWPEAIDAAIESIETAPFLSEAERRDILYHNAVRFLRLDATTATASQQQ